jgi:hypothetical protein
VIGNGIALFRLTRRAARSQVRRVGRVLTLLAQGKPYINVLHTLRSKTPEVQNHWYLINLIVGIIVFTDKLRPRTFGAKYDVSNSHFTS